MGELDYAQEVPFNAHIQLRVCKKPSNATRRQTSTYPPELACIVVPVLPQSRLQSLHIAQERLVDGQGVPCFRVAIENEHFREMARQPLADPHVNGCKPAKCLTAS